MGVGRSTPQKLCLFQTVVCDWLQHKRLHRESLRIEGEVERRRREGKEGERSVLGAFTGTWYRSEPKPGWNGMWGSRRGLDFDDLSLDLQSAQPKTMDNEIMRL